MCSHYRTVRTGPGAPALRSTPGPDARALTPQTATRGPRQRMRWTNGRRGPPPSGRCLRRALCPARIPPQPVPPRHSTNQDPRRPMAPRVRRGSCRDGGRTRYPSVTGAVPRAPPTRPRRARHQRVGPETSSGVRLPLRARRPRRRSGRPGMSLGLTPRQPCLVRASEVVRRDRQEINNAGREEAPPNQHSDGDGQAPIRAID